MQQSASAAWKLHWSRDVPGHLVTNTAPWGRANGPFAGLTPQMGRRNAVLKFRVLIGEKLFLSAAMLNSTTCGRQCSLSVTMQISGSDDWRIGWRDLSRCVHLLEETE